MGNIGTYPPQNVSAQTPTLGYAEVTTSQTGITGADKDLTGLAVTITVPAGRRIKVTGFIPQFNRTAGTVNYINLQVMEGTTTKSLVTINPNNLYAGGEVIAVITPSAGSHTYKLQVDLDAAATVDMVVSATEFLAFILVEDITGSQLPVLPQSVPVGVVAQKRTTTISAAYDTWGLITELSMTAPPFVSGRQYEVTVHGFMDASADSEWTLYTWFGEVNAQQLARKKVLAGDIVEFHGGGLFSPVDGGRLAVYAVRQSGTGTLQIGGMDADHASWVIIKDVTPTPAPANTAPSSTLGYAEVIAYQSTITTEVDLTGLATTVTVPAGRRLRLTGNVGYSRSVADGLTRVNIKEGSTVLNFRDDGVDHAGNGANQLTVQAVISPTAGTHTYKLSMQRLTGTGNTELTAGPTFPSFILIEDITGSGVSGHIHSELDDSGWVSLVPYLVNGWLSYDNNYGPPRFRKKAGVVYVQGLIKLGTLGSVIATLPTGFRPSIPILLVVGNEHNGATPGRLDVYSDGRIVHAGGAWNDYVTMSGIIFPADQ